MKVLLQAFSAITMILCTGIMLVTSYSFDAGNSDSWKQGASLSVIAGVVSIWFAIASFWFDDESTP